MPAEQMDDLRAALSQFPVPAYALARLLLEYSVELSDSPRRLHERAPPHPESVRR